MDKVAVGFWGAFYGMAALMLVLSAAAWLRLHKRVALMAGLTSVFAGTFTLVHLGWLPLDQPIESRVLAHVSITTAVTLALMLMSTLGMLRQRAGGRRSVSILCGAGTLMLGLSWLLPPRDAVVLSTATALGIGFVMLAVAARGALRNDRAGWTAVLGLVFMLLAIAGLGWIALHRPAPWPVHAATAVAGIAYLVVITAVLWGRYSYLLELAEVMAHGPSYDPVTRMRSHSETGQMVGDVFFGREGEASRSIGVIAISIANLYALENLHGRAAFNHALFVCAGRLRRSVPDNVEMGRLGEDGFLLLVRNAPDLARLGQVARVIRERLARPVALSVSRDPAGLEDAHTAWVAEVGIGVLATNTQVRPSQAVSTARAMARTAWTYGSRLAFYDEAEGRIAEMPREESGLLAAQPA